MQDNVLPPELFPQPSHRLLQKSKSMTHVTCLDMHETVVLVIIAGFLPTGHGM